MAEYSKLRTFLDTIVKNSARHMERLIDDMLGLSRLSQSEMHIQMIDMSALAAEIAGDLRADDPRRDVVIAIEPSMKAAGDPGFLHIVMTNLLGNAWKFTSRRECAYIEVGTIVDPKHGRAFYIRDNGIGFDEAYRDRLFNAFQRLHSVQEFPGTGIGLATVARAVQRHGGEVWAEGEVDKGAVFYFSIPQ